MCQSDFLHAVRAHPPPGRDRAEGEEMMQGTTSGTGQNLGFNSQSSRLDEAKK
jgi:hypothetical protein